MPETRRPHSHTHLITATLLAGLVMAGLEALLTLVLLVGVRRDPGASY